MEVKTCPAVPVDPDTANVLLKLMVVNLPVDAVVAPIAMLSIVPALVGFIWIEPDPVGFMCTWPVPVGLMSICAFAPFMLVETSNVRLFPPPAPHCNCAVPLALRKAPPALFAASK